MKAFKTSVACAIAVATFFVSSSSILAATTVSCPAPALYLNMSRGNSNDANTGGQVSSLQVFLWQYKSIYPSWSFPDNRENFVVGIYGRRTEAVVKDFQKTFMSSVVGTSGYGMVGPITRGEIENQCKGSLSISVLKPNGGESWPVNQAQAIRWCGNGNFPVVLSSVFLKSTDGSIYRMLAQPPSIVSCAHAQGGNYFWWSPPSGEGLEGKFHNISVVYKSINNGAVLADDSSDASFTITGTTSTSMVGGYTVTLDSSSPVQQWVVAGSAGVTTTQLRFTSTSTESIALTSLRLQAQSVKGDNAERHITNISLWDGSQLITSKILPAFTNGYEDFQFPISGASAFVIPANSYKRMTVKIDVASICAGCSGSAGSPVNVDFDGDGTSLGKNKAVGLSSALSIKASSVQDTISCGITYFRSVPTFSYVPLAVTSLTGGSQVLYRFNVTANPAYDIALRKFTFRIATSGVASMATAPPSFQLHNVTDNKFVNTATATTALYFKSGKNYDSNGNLIVRAYSDSSNYINEVRIPAGQTRLFELRVSITTDGVGDSVSTILLGDSMGLAFGMSSIQVPLEVGYDSKVIWSDYSGELTGSHSLLSSDWTNGLRAPGLPSTGLQTAVLSSASSVDLGPPVVNITYPFETSTSTSPIFVRATITDDVGVATSTWANLTTGASGGMMRNGNIYTSLRNIYLASGQNIIRVTAADFVGNSSTQTISITKVAEGIPPTVQILIPTSADTYTTTQNKITLSALIEDNVAVSTSTAVWRNSANGATGTVVPTIYGWAAVNIPLVTGTNVITYTAMDTAGNIGTDSLTVTYNAGVGAAPSQKKIDPKALASILSALQVLIAQLQSMLWQ